MTDWQSGKFRSVLAPASLIGKSVHFIVSIVVILGLSYVLGHVLLEDPFRGASGDRALHIAYTEWLNQYFPSFPHWFPAAGGGVSLIHGYPILSHTLVIVIHRLTGLTLLQSGAVLGFMSFPVTSIGVYLFCWSALKRQTVAIIAAIFFLIAPLTWTWIYNWGFLPYSVSLVFLPVTLIFYDRYLSLVLVEPRSGLRRIWLVGVVIGIALATLTHPSAAAGAVVLILLYSFFYSLTGGSGSRTEILLYAAKAVLLSAALVAMILAFYLLPFYKYGQIANREGLNLLPVHLVPHLPKAEFFGLSPIDVNIIHTRMSNPLIVTVLLVIGLIISARTSRKAMALILSAIAAAILSLFPEFSYSLRNISSSLSMVFSIRAALGAVMVLFPVGAAYGVWALASLIVSPFSISRRSDPGTRVAAANQSGIRGLAAGGLALVLAGVSTVWLGTLHATEPNHVSYGPAADGIDMRDIWDRRSADLCELQPSNPQSRSLCELPEARSRLNIQDFLMGCDRLRDSGLEAPSLCTELMPDSAAVASFVAECEGTKSLGQDAGPCGALVPSIFERIASSWPDPKISEANWMIESIIELADFMPSDSSGRIDISSYLGRITQYFTVFSGTSQIQAYTNQLSLIHGIWGYQSGVFNTSEAGSPQSLNELADWLGIQFVFLNPDYDPIEKFKAAGWEQTSSGASALVMQNPRMPEMATITTRPTILVIGGQDNGSYSQLFRMANEGLAPYSEFLIVEGNDRIDRYSLDELQLFDILFLHGYDYKNSKRTWDLLEQYVREGGSLFLDTGWQFEVPEWEFEQAPDVLPVSAVIWTNAGQMPAYSLEATQFAGDIDPSLFDPMVWESSPWSFSGASRIDLRSWSSPILNVQDYVVIAGGEFGEGRVVWSGMNYLAHLIVYENGEEIRLLHNLLSWLGNYDSKPDAPEVAVTRSHPDRVDFSLTGLENDRAWLYWREAQYPNWHANLIDDFGARELPIYRAGPGFMLMPIDVSSETATVVLEWRRSGAEAGAWLATAAGLVVLFGFVIDGLFLGGNGLTWLKIALLMRIPRPFLGDGANKDWVERKRAEIEGRAIAGPRKIYKPDDALPWLRSDKGGNHQDHPTPLDGHVDDDVRPIDIKSSENERELLDNWLKNSDHEDDEWAEKLLSKRERNEEM